MGLLDVFHRTVIFNGFGGCLSLFVIKTLRPGKSLKIVFKKQNTTAKIFIAVNGANFYYELTILYFVCYI